MVFFYIYFMWALRMDVAKWLHFSFACTAAQSTVAPLTLWKVIRLFHTRLGSTTGICSFLHQSSGINPFGIDKISMKS